MKVDFYVLENATRLQAMRELGVILEKLVNDIGWVSTQNQTQPSIYVHTSSPNESEQLDQFLWTYRDDSFLPHNQVNAGEAPIMIGHENPPTNATTLVNLTNQIPGFYKQFQQVIELVFGDAATQQAARERFKQYREAGLELNTHKMKVSNA